MKLLLLIAFPFYGFAAGNQLAPGGNFSVVNPANALMGSAQVQLSYSTNSITVTGAGYAPVNQTYTFESNGICSPDNGLTFFYARVYQSTDQKIAIYDVDPSRNPGGWIGTNDGIKLNAGTSAMYFYYWYGKDGIQPAKWIYNGMGSSWNAPLGVAPSPTFTYQGQTYSSAGVGMDIRQAMECPNIGDEQMLDTNPELYEPNNAGYYLFYQPANKQGVIRSIKYTSGAGFVNTSRTSIRELKSSTNSIRLTIWCDLGTLGSFGIPANAPTMDLPFVTLMGNRYRTNINWGIYDYNTEYVDVSSRYTANTINTSFDNQYTLRFHMPIYYTNGIYIQVTSNGFSMGGGYAEITYENGVLPYPWNTIRARSQFYSTTNTISPTNLIFFNYNNAPALITGLMISVQSSDVNWPETLFRYGWSWAADAEDTFLNSYFFNFGIMMNRYAGTTTLNGPNPPNAPSQIEAYRFWNKYDAPVWFGNPTPLLGQWGQHVSGSSAQFDALTLFYAP